MDLAKDIVGWGVLAIMCGGSLYAVFKDAANEANNNKENAPEHPEELNSAKKVVQFPAQKL